MLLCFLQQVCWLPVCLSPVTMSTQCFIWIDSLLTDRWWGTIEVWDSLWDTRVRQGWAEPLLYMPHLHSSWVALKLYMGLLCLRPCNSRPSYFYRLPGERSLDCHGRPWPALRCSTQLIVQQFFRMTCKKVGKLAWTVFLGAVPIVWTSLEWREEFMGICSFQSHKHLV